MLRSLLTQSLSPQKLTPFEKRKKACVIYGTIAYMCPLLTTVEDAGHRLNKCVNTLTETSMVKMAQPEPMRPSSHQPTKNPVRVLD